MGGGRSEVSPGPVRGGERNIQVQTRPHFFSMDEKANEVVLSHSYTELPVLSGPRL
jgi:hypothetical protein